MRPLVLVLLGWLAIATPGEPSPKLRHAAYLALLPTAASTTVRLASWRQGTRYAEPLTWRLVTGEEELQVGQVPLGETADVTAALPDRLTVLALEPGWNLATTAVEGADAAVVCDPAHPVTIVGPGTFAIYQLAGEDAAIAVAASVTREGCRVILTADEHVLADQSGDFDEPVIFKVPGTGAARVLGLSIAAPRERELRLDDVELRLLSGTAPYLALDSESARSLGERWLTWRAAR